MNGQRLRQLRLARGLSLDALAAALGGVVTKQALLKYEQGKAQPSAIVLSKLASVLGVKAASLYEQAAVQVEFIAYRKGSGLLKRDEDKIKSQVGLALEERIRLQERVQQANGIDVPVQSLPVGSLAEAEDRAGELRQHWKLGIDPIGNVTSVLEEHRVHVVEIDADEKFDGISAFAYDEDRHVAAAAVVTRRGLSGDRQRLSLTHELGHLVLKVAEDVDEEAAAFRFAGAFLAPEECVFREVGRRRVLIQWQELGLLKRQFGMSRQALMRRLRDLEVITPSYYRQWCIDISQMGYRKHEPDPLVPEQPQWFTRTVLRAVSEGLLSQEEAERMLGEKVSTETSLSLVERRAFLKLPMEERRRLMALQAEKMGSYYEENQDWKGLMEGELVDY
jgi:transcriptional regulator with XRE-family HTH domain/Zn-dependent peptidase ImmA (M78 family)